MKNHGFGGLGGSKGGLGEGLGAILAPIAEKVIKKRRKSDLVDPPLGDPFEGQNGKKK